MQELKDAFRDLDERRRETYVQNLEKVRRNSGNVLGMIEILKRADDDLELAQPRGLILDFDSTVAHYAEQKESEDAQAVYEALVASKLLADKLQLTIHV